MKATKDGKGGEPFIYASKESVATNAPIATTLTATKYFLWTFPIPNFIKIQEMVENTCKTSLRGYIKKGLYFTDF